MTIPVDINNHHSSIDTSRDEEIAQTLQEQFRLEAEMTITTSTTAAVPTTTTTTTTTATTTLVKQDQLNVNPSTVGLMEVDTAVTVPVGLDLERHNACFPPTILPTIDFMIPPPPSGPPPQHMSRGSEYDDALLRQCDDCRLCGCCLTVTQCSVLLFCPVFVAMGVCLRLFSADLQHDTLKLVFITAGIMMIWSMYICYFLRMAKHWGTKSREQDDSFCCALIQVLIVMFGPLITALVLGIFIYNLGYWGGLVFMICGMMSWAFYPLCLLGLMGSSSKVSRGKWKWTGEEWVWDAIAIAGDGGCGDGGGGEGGCCGGDGGGCGGGGGGGDGG